IMRGEKIVKPLTRGRADAPVAAVALIGTVDEKRLVREHRNRLAGAIRKLAFKPFKLLFFRGLARADDQAVEADQRPAAVFLSPAVCSEMPVPARQPFGIGGLVAFGQMPDVVIAGQHQSGGGKFIEAGTA